jgi:hypothetical protein
MKFSRTSLFRFLAGFVGSLLASLALHAQQTITATAGQVGNAYSYQVTSSAVAPLTYGASGLPAGLAINSSTGLITGTPSAAGTFTGNVSVTSGGNTNNAAISITIAAAANASVVTSATTATGTVGTAFTYNSAATNAPTSYNITGLPAGLTANTTTGVISGTPTSVGPSSITISANNAAGTGSPVTVTLTVGAPAAAPVISSATTASVAVSGAFTYTITAAPAATSFAASGLPLGLSLNTTTGVISGTPTVANSYSVTLTATNAGGTSAPRTLTLTVGALSAITSAATSTGAVGAVYSFSVTSAVVVPAVTSYNISGLPAGLSANTTTGAVTGTPTTAGTYTVSLSANNATGTGPVSTLTLTIGNLPAITSIATAAGTVGTPFTYNIAASFTPTSYAATGLPGGLVVNTATGLINGTPTTSGAFAVSLTATNSFGTGTATTLTVTIAAAPVIGGGGGVLGSAPAVTTNPADQSVTEGGTATFTVVATGTAPLTYQWRRDLVAISGGTSATLTLTGVKLADAGSYSVLVSNAIGSTGSGPAQLTVAALTTPPSITTQPVSQTIPPGNTATFTVVATGASPLAYQWRKNGTPIAGATASTLTIRSASVSDNGAYTVVVTNSIGTATSSAANLSVDSGAVAPAITTQPVAQVANVGGNVTLSVTATGTAPLSYQWFRDGVALPGATAATLALTNVQGSDSGAYSVRITSSAGTVTSNAATLTVPAARLANVSVRSGAGVGDQTLIVGLAVGGTGTKQVLVRAIGPGLTQFGLTGALADPQLRLFNAAGVQTNSNEDWGGGATLTAAFSAVGAFGLPAASKDAALLVPLATGSFTAQVSSTAGTGTALLEAYDSDAAVTTARFVNISARTQVGTGDNILVIGFVVTGTGPKNVLIRAIGPGLTQFGLGGVLADPQLRLFNAAGVATDTNDDWAATPALAAAHGNAFSQTGAFGLPSSSKDAALLVTLQPGAYTAQVSGVAGTTGVALVEVYEAP